MIWVKKLLFLSCSPHKDGVGDSLASCFANAFLPSGLPLELLFLRDFHILPCDGCSFCAHAPHSCKFLHRDELQTLYSRISASALLILVAPIYFYALPAICAAFINRAQQLWHRNRQNSGSGAFPPGLLLLAAGRDRGKKLFTGAKLSFGYFFRATASSLLATYGFRGLENVNSFRRNEGLKAFLEIKAGAWATYTRLNLDK